ncbi:MAG: 5'-3' exonuclease H3TH domain-containing protein [Wenzhouxiangella sp.]|nr:5'-3' exonuclease H3TH domain-containing protein [Wenzhouxiangella sp.]
MPNSSPTYLVDASVYIFRAWFSMPEGFENPQGQPTNAVYGFARFLCELIEHTQTQQLAIAFDESLTSSFRNELYADYKANRDPAPADLKRQFAWCRDLVGALGVPAYWSDRYEADDLLASLAGHCQNQNTPICVVTGDKDLAQLVLGPDDSWWDFARNRRLDRLGIHAHFGVHPYQIADFLALTGDSVDNIPGVPGIGPKTAAALLHHFDNLDAILARIDEIEWLSLRGAKRVATALKTHQDAARLARQLTGLADQIDTVHADPRVNRERGCPDSLDALLDGLGFGQALRKRLHNAFFDA